jgi:hypothetical protein
MNELHRLILAARRLERQCFATAAAASGTPSWGRFTQVAERLRAWNRAWQLMLETRSLGLAKGLLGMLCEISTELSVCCKEAVQYWSMGRLQQELHTTMDVGRQMADSMVELTRAVQARLGQEPTPTSRHNGETVKM